MAELGRARTGCCAAEAQAECCEPGEKGGCCAPGSASCGCEAGGAETGVREQVRARYAAAGLGEVELRETHRVREHAGAAIIRATKRSAHP